MIDYNKLTKSETIEHARSLCVVVNNLRAYINVQNVYIGAAEAFANATSQQSAAKHSAVMEATMLHLTEFEPIVAKLINQWAATYAVVLDPEDRN